MASADVIWGIINKNNCFMKKGLNGTIWSKEANNLAGIHNFKFSGIANPKTVAITAAGGEKGLPVKVTMTKAKAANTPAKSTYSTTMTKDFRRQAKGLAKEVGKYRPDLKEYALRRLGAVNKSLRVAKGGVSK
mmetsp:Transcript_64761/g.204491  ORF Transcript_64761/g.204491 Transcript_64761/m.204491 type:complete len:133 (+) Transcript_64761:133-531(+)